MDEINKSETNKDELDKDKIDNVEPSKDDYSTDLSEINLNDFSDESEMNNKVFSLLKYAFSMPFVIVDRKKYLADSFRNKVSPELLRSIVSGSPITADIDKNIIHKVAEDSISYEKICATTTSAISGLPGGFAMLPASLADAAQFLGHELRLIQKLAYLYGYPDFRDDYGGLDDGSKIVILSFLGVMYQTKGAATLVQDISRHLAQRTAKKLAKKSLTKTIWYSPVKKLLTYLGYSINKQLIARTAQKAIPILGAGISGSITYLMFNKHSKTLLQHFEENPVK